LSRDGVVVAISKSAEPAGTAFTGLREATSRRLSNSDSSNHLNCIRGRGLSKLPAGLRNIWVVCPNFSWVLVLAV
jgi:hypothetical protein